MNESKQIDVISVGDIVTDAFIKLLDDQAVDFENDRGRWLGIPFATKIPFDHAYIIEAVGNASNASVAFAKLGLKSSLYANVGDDEHGRNMLTTLQKAKVGTEFIRVNAGKKSNYHYVLWYKDERTILIKHEEYNYHWPKLHQSEIPKWIYFSSISEHAMAFHDDLADWLEQNPEVKMAFQPGTFQIQAGVERLKRIYQGSDLLAVNREEAVTISGGSHDNIHDLFDRLHALGPKIVVISDGPSGSYASDGSTRLKMPIYPDPQPPYDRTGAGDAFSSTFVAEIIKGNSIVGALQLAPINSMSVVQKVGAQAGLLSEREIGEWLKRAPRSYKPQRF